jgi:hypothetical protein
VPEDDNPFERYDLDPKDGVAAITARLKELAEDARDDAERERVREAWEELTLHPARRLRAALLAHPESRPPLGAPPPMRRVAVAAGAARGAHGADGQALSFRDLAARPSVLAALGRAHERDAGRGQPGEPAFAPSLDDDPVF